MGAGVNERALSQPRGGSVTAPVANLDMEKHHGYQQNRLHRIRY